MTEFIPHFAGVVTILFGFAFYLGLQEFKKLDPRDMSNENEDENVNR